MTSTGRFKARGQVWTKHLASVLLIFCADNRGSVGAPLVLLRRSCRTVGEARRAGERLNEQVAQRESERERSSVLAAGRKEGRNTCKRSHRASLRASSSSTARWARGASRARRRALLPVEVAGAGGRGGRGERKTKKSLVARLRLRASVLSTLGPGRDWRTPTARPCAASALAPRACPRPPTSPPVPPPVPTTSPRARPPLAQRALAAHAAPCPGRPVLVDVQHRCSRRHRRLLGPKSCRLATLHGCSSDQCHT
jgi:hypothetical protein